MADFDEDKWWETLPPLSDCAKKSTVTDAMKADLERKLTARYGPPRCREPMRHAPDCECGRL